MALMNSLGPTIHATRCEVVSKLSTGSLWWLHPARKAKSLGQSIDDENVVLIHVLDVVGGRHDGAVAIASIIVAAVKLVHNECRAV